MVLKGFDVGAKVSTCGVMKGEPLMKLATRDQNKIHEAHACMHAPGTLLLSSLSLPVNSHAPSHAIVTSKTIISLYYMIPM